MNIFDFTKKTIHRQLLEEQLKKLTPKLSGKILDIGSKDARYASWFSGEVVSVDVIPNSAKKVLKDDIYNLNFAKDTFDAVLSTEVFQYLDSPKKALAEIWRVLKPEGILLLSSPVVYRVHQDLVRYTQEQWERLLSEFKKVEFFYLGNFYTIILDIIREKITKLPNRFLRYFLYLPLLLLLLFVPLANKLSKDRNFVSGYLIMARK